jgi:hypothetical protein
MKRVDTIKLKKLIKIGIKENQTDYNSIRNKTKKKGTTKNKKVLKKMNKKNQTEYNNSKKHKTKQNKKDLKK